MQYKTKSRLVTIAVSLNLLWPVVGVIWRDVTTQTYWLSIPVEQQTQKEEKETEMPEKVWPFIPHEEDEIPQYTSPTEPVELPRTIEPSPLTPTYEPQEPTPEPSPPIPEPTPEPSPIEPSQEPVEWSKYVIPDPSSTAGTRRKNNRTPKTVKENYQWLYMDTGKVRHIVWMTNGKLNRRSICGKQPYEWMSAGAKFLPECATCKSYLPRDLET